MLMNDVSQVVRVGTPRAACGDSREALFEPPDATLFGHSAAVDCRVHSERIPKPSAGSPRSRAQASAKS